MRGGLTTEGGTIIHCNCSMEEQTDGTKGKDGHEAE